MSGPDSPAPTPAPGDRGPTGSPVPGDSPIPGDSPVPGDRPPTGRRLDARPSSRYEDQGEGGPGTTDGASKVRGVLFGLLVAAFVGLLMVLLGSLLDLTAGLVVAAFFLGQLTAVGVRAGAGASLGQTARAWVSVLIALGALVLVQLGLWAWAVGQGGVLGPLDYVRDVFGALVAIEAVLAAIGAWWGSR